MKRPDLISVLFAVVILSAACAPPSPEPIQKTEIPPTDIPPTTTPIQPTATADPTSTPAPQEVLDPLVPAGSALITAGNVGNLQLVAELPNAKIEGLCFSPDNHYLGLNIYESTLWGVMDLQTGEMIQELDLEKGPNYLTHECYFSEDNAVFNLMITESITETKVIQWDLSTGQKLGEIPAKRATYSKDGSIRVYSEYGKLVVEDALTNQTLYKFDTDKLADLDISADNKYLVSTHPDVYQMDTAFWDLEKGIQATTLFGVECVTFSGGEYFAAVLENDPQADAGELSLINEYDFNDKKILIAEGVGYPLYSCPIFGYRSDFVVARWGDYFRFWDTASGEELLKIPAVFGDQFGFSQNMALFYILHPTYYLRIYAVSGE